jgi:hypothetical protein
MRLPTSTVVMALLACIPFGLAIRDTLREPAPPDVDQHDGDEDGDGAVQLAKDEAEQAEREAAREVAEQQAQAARKTALSDLLGAEPATLGAVLGAIQLGERDHQVMQRVLDRFAAERSAKAYAVAFHGADELRGVEITPSGDDRDAACTDLQARLTEVWGEGQYDAGIEGTHWANAARGQRATLIEAGTCTVTIEKFVPVASYLSKAATSTIPLWAIGSPAKKLADSLPGAEHADDTLSWETAGVGAGLGTTKLMARVGGGKVTSIAAYTEMAPATSDAVTEQLRTLYGEPTDDHGRLVWSKQPSITLDLTTTATTAIFVGDPKE